MDNVTETPASDRDRPGARAQAVLREESWSDIERRWGLFGASSAIVSEARRHGSKPTGVELNGSVVYPGFQFTEQDDVGVVVAAAWTALLEALTTRWSEANAVLWTCSVNAYLGGGTPAEEVQSSPQAMSAALSHAVEAAFAPLPRF